MEITFCRDTYIGQVSVSGEKRHFKAQEKLLLMASPRFRRKMGCHYFACCLGWRFCLRRRYPPESSQSFSETDDLIDK